MINCAAYTKVDLAEKESELCRAINTDAVRMLARVCNERGLRLVHFSTDYVFSGGDGRETPFRETDDTSPQGVYARTKLDGEIAAAECDQHLVIRTCGLYGRLNKAGQGNFVETILRLARQKPELRIVNDHTLHTERGRGYCERDPGFVGGESSKLEGCFMLSIAGRRRGTILRENC